MVQEFLDFAKWFLLPLSAFLVALVIYRLASRIQLVHRVRYPILIGLMLGAVTWMFLLKPVDPEGIPARVLRMLLYLDLVYLALRLCETIFFEEMLRKRQIKFPRFFRDIARVLVLVLAVTVLLKLVFGVEPSALLVTSTVLSAVIGLALQDVLANIFAGAALQMERPFAVGQWVLIGDREGRVTEMSWRTTKIRTRDNEILIVPNTTVAQNDILNYNEPDELHRVNLDIGTSYNDPPEQVKRSLLALLRDTEGVAEEPPPVIHTTGYGDFSINYKLRFWIRDYEQRLNIEDRVMSKIWYRFKRDGIHIPFPIRSITVEQVEHQEAVAEADRQHRLDDMTHYMKGIDILAPFSEETLHQLAERGRSQIYGKHEMLVRQGDQDSSFYIILSGRVTVFTEMDNRRTDIGSFEAGSYFGEIALLTGQKRTASVMATEETEALVISKRIFAPLMEENPELAVTLSEILKKRAQELQKAKDEITLRRKVKQQRLEDSGTNLLSSIQRFFNL